MPIQPPSDRTCARGEPPSPDFWLLTSGFSPILRNEPNFPPAHNPNAQNEPNPGTRNLRNKPNFPRSQISDVRFRISPHPDRAKRTQFTSPGTLPPAFPSPKCRSEAEIPKGVYGVYPPQADRRRAEADRSPASTYIAPRFHRRGPSPLSSSRK